MIRVHLGIGGLMAVVAPVSATTSYRSVNARIMIAPDPAGTYASRGLICRCPRGSTDSRSTLRWGLAPRVDTAL